MHIRKLKELDEHPALIPRASLQPVMDVFHSLEQPVVFRALTTE